jgi:hypothetical protein
MEKSTIIVMSIQFGALVVAILSLTFQQYQAAKTAARIDQRTEMKLKLFYLIQEKEMMLDEIISRYQQVIPLKQKVDHVEIRKSLYEMLNDRTVLFTRDMTYKPNIGSQSVSA